VIPEMALWERVERYSGLCGFFLVRDPAVFVGETVTGGWLGGQVFVLWGQAIVGGVQALPGNCFRTNTLSTLFTVAGRLK
jgi:hypothetical protein